MGVTVFDSDVLIAFLSSGDAQHAAAVSVVRKATESGGRRVVTTLNYAELLVWPLRRDGAVGRQRIDEMLDGLKIEVETVDRELAALAASVRAETGLKLPDAHVVATSLRARSTGQDVWLHSFDRQVVHAFAELAAQR